VPPGTNFNLTDWAIQFPIPNPASNTGDTGNSVDEEANWWLVDGNTYAPYFTTAADGGMALWDPESGSTTSGSSYPRTELREVNAQDQDASWPWTGTNTLTVTESVNFGTVPSTHVCIIQSHVAEDDPVSTGGNKNPPFLEIFYTNTGEFEYGVYPGPSGSEGAPHPFSPAITVTPGTKFTAVLSMSNSTMTFTVNGTTAGWGQPITADVPTSYVTSVALPADLGAGAWTSATQFYFKAGNYDQYTGSSTTTGMTVEIYQLIAAHSGPIAVPF
jgi:hypothetical protein